MAPATSLNLCVDIGVCRWVCIVVYNSWVNFCQVKKAVQALQAFLKTKSTLDSLFLDETQQISLLFTLWQIPKEAQTIRMWVSELGTYSCHCFDYFLTSETYTLMFHCVFSPLPHGQRPDTDEVCLFTRDEPNMTSDQTQRFYKKLLEEKGVKNISEVPTTQSP